VRVFERFVVAFGNREHDDPGAFAEIEQRRAHEVADILANARSALRGGRWASLDMSNTQPAAK
jgi:hypothetical protein